MPSRIGIHKVRKHDRLVVKFDGEKEGSVKQLTLSAINKIIMKSKMVSQKQHFINHLGNLPLDAEKIYDLSAVVYEYNPMNKPPLQIKLDEKGRPIGDVNTFQALYIEIDGNTYAIDGNSLNKEDFEENSDFTVTELMSQ
ncbi:hypothetical protein [Enterobacter kobei]|uniref:hypothetical protein n=1 Tax=Enterobacter kobei TaxID=208224 RepID=UPI003CF3DE9C